MYHDNSSRSPGAHRQYPGHLNAPANFQRSLHRQPSSHFDPYSAAAAGNGNGNGAATGFPAASSTAGLYDDTFPRYESARLDRLGQMPSAGAVSPGVGYPYDLSGSQTWNVTTPGLFGASLAGLAATTGSGAMTSHIKPQSRGGRTALPSTWLDQAAGLGGSPFGLGPASNGGTPTPAQLLQPSGLRAESMTPTPSHHDAGGEDELIPTAIVIKNIPFAVKKEQLVQLMTELNLPLPYAFNYHFDNGVFRGLAFANFTTPEETAAVIDTLNHYELHGRKLRVEYKKMLPLQERERIEREKRERRGQLEEQHRPVPASQLHTQPSMSSLAGQMHATSPGPAANSRTKLEVDMNDPDTLRFYTELLLFKQDVNRDVCIFPPTLTPIQRRTVHTLAHNFGLSHSSRGNGSERAVHVFRTPVPPGTGAGLSPSNAMSNLHSMDGRRGLNRAATIDFSESRADNTMSPFSALRTHPSSGFLNVMDSTGTAFANSASGSTSGGVGAPGSQNLRAAKSFADLRSYSPSPALSTSSFPASALQSNQPSSRSGGYDVNGAAAAAAAAAANGGASAVGTPGISSTAATANPTPSMTSTPSGSSLGTFQRSATQEDIFTPLGQLSLGPGFPNSGASNSPRRLRSMFSWDQTDGPVSTPLGGANGGMTPVTSTSPIATQVTSAGTESRHTTPGSASSATAGGGSGGANAPIGSQRYDQERMRPQRQTSFGYGQQRSGQQSREGDELRGSGRNGVEIIVE